LFTPLLDTLLFFTVTTPLVNLLPQRFASKKLASGYASFGLALALLLLPIYYMEGFTQGKVTTTLMDLFSGVFSSQFFFMGQGIGSAFIDAGVYNKINIIT